MSEFEIVTVASGAKSLRSIEHGQTFHPVTGPMGEAVPLHVDQQRLAERATTCSPPFVVWDVGLGAAANALAAIDRLAAHQLGAHIHSFEQSLSPLRFALDHAADLGYIAPHENLIRTLLSSGTATLDTGETRIVWHLHLGDFREQIRTATPEAPHAILYDPYSPSANPGMWTLEHFSLLRECLADDVPCLWTNYTRSTSVRVTLLLAGFYVGRGRSIGEKSETTVASNSLPLIEQPLDLGWLDRVRRSTHSAPLRDGEQHPTISASDWGHLLAHPQFGE